MKVGIVGFGAIGGYIACLLASHGVEVVALARGAALDPALRFSVTPLGGETRWAGERLHRVADPAELADCDWVGLAVKSGDTEAVAATLADHLRPTTPVISLQNGLSNPERIRNAGLEAVDGIVTFNVRLERSAETWSFPQTTSGPLVIGEHAGISPRLDEILQRGGVGLQRRKDVRDLMRGKLALNLNNGVCAVAGVSIAQSVASRDLRRSYAAAIREALAIFEARGESVRALGRLAPGLIATVLPWPDALVRILARPMVQIDPAARSSTLVDLEAGKRTEIDELNGALPGLAAAVGRGAPVNHWIRDQIRRLEDQGDERRHPSAAEIWREVSARSID